MCGRQQQQQLTGEATRLQLCLLRMHRKTMPPSHSQQPAITPPAAAVGVGLQAQQPAVLPQAAALVPLAALQQCQQVSTISRLSSSLHVSSAAAAAIGGDAQVCVVDVWRLTFLWLQQQLQQHGSVAGSSLLSFACMSCTYQRPLCSQVHAHTHREHTPSSIPSNDSPRVTLPPLSLSACAALGRRDRRR